MEVKDYIIHNMRIIIMKIICILYVKMTYNVCKRIPIIWIQRYTHG